MDTNVTTIEIRPGFLQPGDRYINHDGTAGWVALDNSYRVEGQPTIAVRVMYLPDGGIGIRYFDDHLPIEVYRPDQPETLTQLFGKD